MKRVRSTGPATLCTTILAAVLVVPAALDARAATAQSVAAVPSTASAASAATSVSAFGLDTPEPGSVEAIAEATTDPRYLSPWVSYVPSSETVPSPTEYLGHIVGAPGELSHSATIYGYLRELARASNRVHVETIGKSAEGRDILLVAIADESGIAQLDDMKAATGALADPRTTTPEQAEEILAEARPFYYFNAGLHADETGSPEMVMELAYRLAVSEQPMIRNIRERLVVLINPVGNPDGRDKMVDWFYRYLKGKTDYDSLPRQSPPYWGKYVYVDANRDGHQLSQEHTRAVARMFFDYHPQVIHDLHEAIALLQTWNGTGPYNPNLDPIVLAEFLEMSFHEVTTLTAFGMPGVWTWDFGEGYGHHYLDSIGMNHNAIGRGYETFGNTTAETVDRTISDWETSREWFRPWPTEKRIRWSLRNNTNYMQTGALAILDHSAKNSKQLLRNFYRKGYNSWQRGVAGNPYAYVIPADQPDRKRVAEMVNHLEKQGIEVSRAIGEFETREGRFDARTFVVRLDQPYRNYAVDLLEPQEFPADAEHTPYDDVSWALPVHYGVETIRIEDPAIHEVELEAVAEEVRPEGAVTGSGSVFLLAERGQEALLAARYRLAEYEVRIAEDSFEIGGVIYAAGSWIVSDDSPRGEGRRGEGSAQLRNDLTRVAQELALDFVAVGAAPEVAAHDARAPRLGIWVPWADTDSIGWIRYTLDRERVPYTYLRDEDIRAGSLNDKVDVILYGNVDLDLQSQIHGIQNKTGPMPFTRTEEFPSHGTPAESEDVTGGIGWKGLAELQGFVEAGGVLATLGNGTTLALEGGLIRNVRRADLDGLESHGVELRATFSRPDHPIAYGYGESPSVFRGNFAAYDTPLRWVRMAYCTACLDGPVDGRHVVMTWGSEDGPMVVSGGARGEDQLTGRPAILDVPVGNGRIVAYNFNPMHRELNRSDFRLLWNAILNWRHLIQ